MAVRKKYHWFGWTFADDFWTIWQDDYRCTEIYTTGPDNCRDALVGLITVG